MMKVGTREKVVLISTDCNAHVGEGVKLLRPRQSPVKAKLCSERSAVDPLR